MRPTLAAALAALSLFTAAPAAAQLSLELRGGAGAGSYGATGAGFQFVPLPAGSATLAYAFHPVVAAYAGYGFARFGCEEGFCDGVDPTFTSQGFAAGLRFELPGGVWARGGAVAHTLEAESSRGTENSDAAYGFEAGAGLGLRLGRRLTLTPGIGYTRYAASVDGSDDPVAFVTGDLGLRFSFSGPGR